MAQIGVAKIGNKDLVWSVLATFFKMGAGVLLFPVILRMLPAETVGIWTVFTVVTSLSLLLDFGFNSSFARNIAYIFTGVESLQKNGFSAASDAVNYDLLKSTIRAMRWFYSRVALALLVLLLTFGTWYIHTLLQTYKGDTTEIYVAWFLLCIINTYNLYTLYYESLMRARGFVKRLNQIILVGNIAYIAVAAVLVLTGFGLVSIVSAQIASVVIIRILSKKYFFDSELVDSLSAANDNRFKEVLTAIYPNAVKVGLTGLGGFLINKSATFIGALYLPLEDIGSYGITMQVVMVFVAMGNLYYTVYLPKVFQWRVEHDFSAIRSVYFKSVGLLVLVYIVCGLGVALCGNWLLGLIGSQTYLFSGTLLFVTLLVAFLEQNHAMAGAFLLSKNEVPFFRASLLSAAATLFLLFLFLAYFKIGLWGLILAPGIAQLCYQNWKWPMEMIKELFIINRVIDEVE